MGKNFLNLRNQLYRSHVRIVVFPVKIAYVCKRGCPHRTINNPTPIVKCHTYSGERGLSSLSLQRNTEFLREKSHTVHENGMKMYLKKIFL